ncbi:MAG: hypothetical protein HYW47_06215 [Deltaproteobacteria bacterium]|nr:hypothetical protein [Deltaproteobacteria bacterium]
MGIQLKVIFTTLLIVSFSEALTQNSFLTYLDFKNYLANHKKEILKEKNIEKRKLKINFLNKILNYSKLLPRKETSFNLEIKENLFNVEIWDEFKGDPLKAMKLYEEITTGQHPHNLFLESKAGQDEIISDLKKINGGFEFISDRVLTSSHAFNNKSKIRLLFFNKDENTFICINQNIEDFGKELAQKKAERMEKNYHPIYYEMTVDFYQKIDNKTFQYVSFNLLDGQAKTSRSTTTNAVKGIGNIFTVGLLDKGIDAHIKEEAHKIWKARKSLFQELILSEETPLQGYQEAK